MLLKWSFGNRKVSKLDAVSFGIPAYQSENGFKTCPAAGACAAVCYARQGAYTWPNTKAAREYNLDQTKAADFAVKAIADLKKIKQSIIRIHDSGDFYSQKYLNSWVEIAKAYPEKTFYAYTKSLNLDFSSIPPNFKLVQSEGGIFDHLLDKTKARSRIFSSDKARIDAGYVDGNENDLPAINGEQNIGLVYHGTKKLTEAQLTYFS